MDILYRYAHFLGIILAAGTLMAEALLVKKKMSGFEMRRMALLDGAFGMSSLVLIAGGLLQWFLGSKPSFFYTHNPVFIVKISLVAVVALASIYPTVHFVRNRKVPDGEVVAVPDAVRYVIRGEMALFLIIPLLAVLMARGIGLH